MKKLNTLSWNSQKLKIWLQKVSPSEAPLKNPVPGSLLKGNVVLVLN